MQFDASSVNVAAVGVGYKRPLLPAGGPFHSFFIQAQKTTCIGNIRHTKLQQAVSVVDFRPIKAYYVNEGSHICPQVLCTI